MKTCTALSFVLLLAAAPFGARAQSVYTDISEPACTAIPASGEPNDEGGLRCRGPAGYELLAVYGDLRASVTVVSPDGAEHPLEFWDSITSAFSSLGPRAEWLLGADGKPVALIVRVLASEDPENPDRKTSYLAVAKLTAGATCVTDRISASADDNARARGAAVGAADRPCLADAQE